MKFLNIRYFELKKPKTGMPKRQMLSICRKEEYSVAELTDIMAFSGYVFLLYKSYMGVSSIHEFNKWFSKANGFFLQWEGCDINY